MPLTCIALLAVDTGHVVIEQLHTLPAVRTGAGLAVVRRARQSVAVVAGGAALTVISHRVVTADTFTCVMQYTTLYIMYI